MFYFTFYFIFFKVYIIIIPPYWSFYTLLADSLHGDNSFNFGRDPTNETGLSASWDCETNKVSVSIGIEVELERFAEDERVIGTEGASSWPLGTQTGTLRTHTHSLDDIGI